MSSRRVESFLLRLVVQDADDLKPETWHGRVQHVMTGSECQFDELEDLVSFIREQFMVARCQLSDEPPSSV